MYVIYDYTYSLVQVTSSCVVSIKVACSQNLTSADFGNLCTKPFFLDIM